MAITKRHSMPLGVEQEQQVGVKCNKPKNARSTKHELDSTAVCTNASCFEGFVLRKGWLCVGTIMCGKTKTIVGEGAELTCALVLS